ncbi:MAG: chromosome segregation protein SMC, partial [Xanthomonadales bacterium]|nr:chromosome segregation protein SMC [Xanthomonadales bacterium]
GYAASHAPALGIEGIPHTVQDELDQRLLAAGRRIEALGQEMRSIDVESLREATAALEKESQALAASENEKQRELDALRASLAETRAELRASEESHRQVQRDLHTREGRLESLRALQQAALEDQSAADWLQEQGLSRAPRLARVIEVDEAWEAAVETVLGHWLQSVLVEAGSDHGRALAGLEHSSLDLLDDRRGGVQPRPGSLAARVRAPDAVLRWLNAVDTVDTLEAAWAARERLAQGASVVTPASEWLGPDWVRIARGQAGQDSMLAREKAIARLEKELDGLAARAAELAAVLSNARETAAKLENRSGELQSEVTALNRKKNEVDGQLDSRRSSIRMLAEREQAIAGERAQLKQQVGEDEQAVREVRGQLEKRLATMAELKEQRDALDGRRRKLMNRRDTARAELGVARDRRHELALKAGSRRASLDSLRQSLQRMDAQLSQTQQRYIGLSEQIAKAGQPEQQHYAEMEQLLKRRVETENRLSESRARLQSLENDYREKDAQRQQAIQHSDEIRQDLERARLQQQELQLNARGLQRQVEERGGDVEELARDIPEDARPDQWEAEIERLAEQIARLEPVNLAAIQEYDEEQERKAYLDAQNDDLCDALTTLENAIARIDRKTRTRFKETFERVNKGVQELFPRLFGGGHAYLELTGEDLLTTGVSIMAQPPGKRVSSLHLLSGGEKALTAVSFVFAIFRLNPAPFCLLDEVDAPLDDANVQRFSTMVREMSETVQFVVVTHNKITMEMAHQMSGVTMREPGVSRLVQVDIDEAARLAAS